MSAGDNLDQIPVSGLIAAKQHQVIIVLFSRRMITVTVSHDIYFTTDDGLDPGIFGQTVELDRAVHHAVVGEGNTIHTKFFHAGNQVRDAAHTIEEAVFAMYMEVSKHGFSLKNDLPDYYNTA